MRLNSKQEFYDAQRWGLTGNHFQSWDSVDDVLRAPDQPEGVYIRGPVAQWPYMVPWCRLKELRRTVSRIPNAAGASFVEVLPFGTPRTINAELSPSSDYWFLTWGRSSKLSLRHDIIRHGKLEKAYGRRLS